MQQLTAQKDTRPCLICSKEGTRHPVEVLPDGGILFMVAHDNGQICKWAEYASILDVTKPNKKKGKTPTYVKCPNCGDRGRLNSAYDLNAAKEERPFTFKYIVVHEIIPGSWGKVKVKKRRRCQSFTPEQRIEILKQIGRYIADPPKPHREIIPKKLDRYIESPIQTKNEEQNPTVSNNNVPKNDRIDRNMEEALAESGQENSQSQANQDRSSKYKGVVPRGKRLTLCTKCNKPGYKYKTYFQHYNEPPIGKVILKGKEIGDRYRRCYLTTQKVKQDNTDHELNSEANQRENSQTHSILRIDSILRDLSRYIEESRSTLSKVRDLSRYIEESRSTLSKEDELGKDYKKMYWDLIDKLNKIVDDTNRYTFI